MSHQVYYDLNEDTIEFINECLSGIYIPVKLKIEYLGATNLKKYPIKLVKPNDMFNHLLGKELVILVNEEMLEKLDDASQKIVVEQELNKIEYNLEKGKLSLSNSNYSTDVGILNKYEKADVVRAMTLVKAIANRDDTLVEGEENANVKDINKKVEVGGATEEKFFQKN